MSDDFHVIKDILLYKNTIVCQQSAAGGVDPVILTDSLNVKAPLRR